MQQKRFLGKFTDLLRNILSKSIATCKRETNFIQVAMVDRSGRWSYDLPHCQIKSCGASNHLSTVQYASIADFNNKLFTYGEEPVVECDEWSLDKAIELNIDISKFLSGTNWSPVLCVGFVTLTPSGYPWQNQNITTYLFANQFAARKIAAIEDFWDNIYPVAFQLRQTSGHGYVVTAAHCVTRNKYEYPPEGLLWSHLTQVWLSVHDRRMDQEEEEEEERQPEYVTRTPAR
ncbi:unnamed protein product [Clavelina lepadiformis]|uniref:Uncharacterized protein n=1 Tax=Clavelina lepadiformis TaxID=159417 RepID=A0ABP0F543_CLALP